MYVNAGCYVIKEIPWWQDISFSSVILQDKNVLRYYEHKHGLTICAAISIFAFIIDILMGSMLNFVDCNRLRE